MAVIKFSKPAVPSVQKALNRFATDHFVIGTPADFIAASESVRFSADGWEGYLNSTECKNYLANGHMPSVALADKFMAALENKFPAPTARHEMADDVVGAFPNVPAFCAGQPLNMRRRVKREHEASPIAIVADLTSSAAISANDVQMRGAAVLALVRAISARRPVELYAGTGLDANRGRDAVYHFIRIETAPLDLARAAFILTHPSVSRGLLYSMSRAYDYRGQWPYGLNQNISRNNYREIIKSGLSHIEDVIAIPSIHMNDKAIKNPVEWISEYARAYGDVPEGED